jgi:plasmid maintenance system antidote protein VapI
MPMKTPPHPGLYQGCLPESVGPERDRRRQGIGVARHTLSRVLNGQAGISAEMAIRLEKAG